MNHAWTGLTIMLSIVGLFVGIAAKKHGTTANSDAKTPQRGVALLRPTKGNKVRGAILLMQTKDGVRFRGRVRGLKPGLHGFHIHQYGDLRSPDGTSAGGHFAPEGHKHGALNAPKSHAGDLGNIKADSQGIAQIDLLAKDLKLSSIAGRALVVHAGADDLKSQPSGNAGPRVAVGVIGFAGPQVKAAAAK